MHQEHYISTEFLSRVVAQAQQIRDTEGGLWHGYIYIYRGEYAGWAAGDPEPWKWCPGVLAISPDSSVYLLAGGNDNDGATETIRLIAEPVPTRPSRKTECAPNSEKPTT